MSVSVSAPTLFVPLSCGPPFFVALFLPLSLVFIVTLVYFLHPKLALSLHLGTRTSLPFFLCLAAVSDGASASPYSALITLTPRFEVQDVFRRHDPLWEVSVPLGDGLCVYMRIWAPVRVCVSPVM